MVIEQSLNEIIGVEDNFFVLTGVNDYVDVQYTITGNEVSVYDFTYQSYNGIITRNVQAIAMTVFGNLKNYQDPFDYKESFLFSESDSYHYIKLDIKITDPVDGEFFINDIVVVNGVLQVGECFDWSVFLDSELSDNPITVPNVPTDLNIDLNFTL